MKVGLVLQHISFVKVERQLRVQLEHSAQVLK